MKRPQTKFHADTMSGSKVIRATESQNLSLGQNLSFAFLQHSFFLFIDILLRLQQQMLTCLCNFSWKFDRLFATSYVIMLLCHYWTIESTLGLEAVDVEV